VDVRRCARRMRGFTDPYGETGLFERAGGGW
jgi:hypothetical protein